MIAPGSRYEDAEHQFTQAHLYNAFGYPYLEGDRPNLKIRVVSRETTYLVSVLSPSPSPQQEYFVKDTEDIQWLGYKFMRDPKEWWRIADANPAYWYPLDMPMGSYIRIPPTQ